MSQSPDLLEKVLPHVQLAIQRAKKLPLFTLGISLVMVLFFVLSAVSHISESFGLRPSDIPDFKLSRLTTYPLVHTSSIQFLISGAAFVPLCSRFERQYGTLRTLAMFLGPFESVPGLFYCLVDAMLRQDQIVTGCSGFVFVLIAIETIQYVNNVSPVVVVGGRKVSTLATPFLLLVLAAVLLPGSSVLIHAASIAVGSIFGSGRVDFLLLPLKVVNFVESRAQVVFSMVPMYITAESATAAYAGLSNDLESMTLEQDVDSPRSVRRESSSTTRPASIRQVSSKWPAGQRED